MIPHYIVLIGIVQMFYCIFLGYNLMREMGAEKFKNYWKVMFGLICFFLMAYILYFYFLDRAITDTSFSKILISLILCFGASFVILVLVVLSKSLTKLKKEEEDIMHSNIELKKSNAGLKATRSKILNMEKRVEEKNKQLENTMDKFYDLRLSMEKQDSLREIKRENRKIKREIERAEK